VVNDAPINGIIVRPVFEVFEAVSPTPKVLCIDWDNTIVKEHTYSLLKNKIQSPCGTIQAPFYLKDKHLFVEGLEAQAPGVDITEYFNNIPTLVQILIDQQFSFREQASMCALIKEALANEHKVAIVAFNNLPQIMPPLLRRLGLTQEEIDKLIIIVNFPRNTKNYKNEHLDFVRELIASDEGISLEAEDLILIDDGKPYIQAAQKKGYTVLEAPEDQPINFNFVREFLDLPVEQALKKSGPGSK